MSSRFRDYRIYFFLALVFIIFAVALPGKFMTADNLRTIAKSSSVNVLPVLGFTLVLIMRQLDLSFASAMTMGGAFSLGVYNALQINDPLKRWTISIVCGVFSGFILGIINGLLVTKAKINSFIVTLGTLTIAQGVVNIYTRGGNITTNDFGFADILDKSSFIAPPIVLAILMTLVAELALRYTRFGRNVCLIGGNPKTAWHAGIPTTTYVVASFVISGVFAALAGALLAIKNGSASPTLGDPSLMLVVTAAIIGGTSMLGGIGSALGSAAAVITLTIIGNGLSLMGGSTDMQKIASSALLAAVVLTEAYSIYRYNLRKGERLDLV